MQEIIYYLLPISAIAIYFWALHKYFSAARDHDQSYWESIGKPSWRNLGASVGVLVFASLLKNSFRKCAAKEIRFWGHLSQVSFIAASTIMICLGAVAPEGIYS